MSVTQCRTCDQPITFVLRDDGRWRPVEITFEELEPKGDEILAVQKTGSWLALPDQVVRVYSAHRCLEDPSWNRGRPRTTVRTDESEEPEVLEVRACTHCGAVDDHDDDECPNRPVAQNPRYRRTREWVLRKMSAEMQWVLTIDCPECRAPKGEPCQRGYDIYFGNGWPSHTVCTQRKLSVAFGEGQQWPPRRNQIGAKQMRDWLAQNVTVLTGEADGA